MIKKELASLYVLDINDFSYIGWVEQYTSLIWTTSYDDVGDFELYLPYSDKMAEMLQIDRVLVRNNNRRLYENGDDLFTYPMIITKVSVSANANSGKMLLITGREFKYLMHRRIVRGTRYFSGKPHEIAYAMVKSGAYDTANTKRTFYFVVPKWFDHDYFANWKSEKIQVTGGNIDEVVSDYVRSYGLGWKLECFLDKNNNASIVEETYMGADRSVDQTANDPVIFSEEYENIYSLEYEKDFSEYGNIAYVYGEGIGSKRVSQTAITEVNGEEVIQSGFDRYEVYVDARDLQQESDVTSDEYKLMLRNRGKEKLAEENTIKEGFSCELLDIQYKLGTDYALGDIVTIKTKWVTRNVRVSQITESYDQNGYKCIPTLTALER